MNKLTDDECSDNIRKFIHESISTIISKRGINIKTKDSTDKITSKLKVNNKEKIK